MSGLSDGVGEEGTLMEDIISNEEIGNRVYRIRGQRVMLSYDLAYLYQVQPKVLMQAVKRNVERFPSDFMFQLSEIELEMCINSRSQIVTLKQGGNIKYRPYAFTEQGIAMLSSVLRSPRAIQVNIAIMRAFVKLRHALFQSKDITAKVEKLEGRVNVHETDIRLIVKDVQELKKKTDPSEEELLKVKGFGKD